MRFIVSSRVVRISMRVVSDILRAIFSISARRSSVSWGKLARMILPEFETERPDLESSMAFMTAGVTEVSQRVISISRGGRTESEPTCLMVNCSP